MCFFLKNSNDKNDIIDFTYENIYTLINKETQNQINATFIYL